MAGAGLVVEGGCVGTGEGIMHVRQMHMLVLMIKIFKVSAPVS